MDERTHLDLGAVGNDFLNLGSNFLGSEIRTAQGKTFDFLLFQMGLHHGFIFGNLLQQVRNTGSGLQFVDIFPNLFEFGDKRIVISCILKIKESITFL
jgi:hypothetical protein